MNLKLGELRSTLSSLAFEDLLLSKRALVQEEEDTLRSCICLEYALWGPSENQETGVNQNWIQF